MKKHLLLCIILLSAFTGMSQVTNQDKNLVSGLLKTSMNVNGLSTDDLDNLEVSSTYQTSDGIRMVYLQQTYKGIPVFNKMQVLAFKNGKLVSQTGGRVQHISQLVNVGTAVPVTSAEFAVRAALADQKIEAPGILIPQVQTTYKKVFGDLGIAKSPVIAELVWLPVSDKEVRLTWQIELAPLKSPDHLLIRVDAVNNAVLDKNNYTVYEQFEHSSNEAASLCQHDNHLQQNTSAQVVSGNSPTVVNSATYRVIPYPAESPIHTGGAAALVTDPWNAAPGNATSLKWHYDGTTYHDSTRGNNVWSQEDRDNNNTTFGLTAPSTTAQPNLTLDYTPNYTLAPTTITNQQFATTNLFYWNNIIHDITYLYGFDEVAGNFQANNQGRGGSGNDYVIADAQDAGGTNNANFSTPVDGTRPRMQMYLWTSVTPNRDGDLDNGIIVHEYGHGISNRLTGGPANSSCLNNAEQGGEGWSDYFALMLTTDWTTATVNDGTLPRPIGTYALAQPTSGVGIRAYPYSTNIAVNPWTYASMAGSSGAVHTIGQMWCVALWEMTWEMIAVDGINTNLFNPAATGGNSAAMKLVIEGMRLQPCNPGFIDARNGILRADTLFFGAKYSCAIWKAFAKRGMGRNASQGSSNSTTDQVADFTNSGSVSMLLTQSVSQQQEGLNVTYTTTINAGSCSPVNNYTLRDTLPLNVTYVSGGSYNAGTRVVSFPVNLALGQSQDFSFTVQVNPGSYYAPVLLIDEPVAGATIPASWTASSTTATNWTVSSAQSTSSPNSFFSLNLITVSDQLLRTTNNITLPTAPPPLTFQGYINAEAGWDGGVVEISTNGGTTWTDLGTNMISGGYNGTLSSSGSNPIRGRSAFTSNSNGFVKTTISLSSYAGQTVQFRFRFGSDASVAGTGWYIDDINLTDIAVVNIRSNLFNSNDIRVGYNDISTIILPDENCNAGSISSQPVNTSLCAGSDAAFSITASGTSLSYQWQVSTDGGNSFTDLSGEINSTLNLTAVNTGMNNNQYRCVINGTCTVNLNSDPAILAVNALPVAPGASGASSCGAGSVTIAASPASGETIDWYADPTGGAAILSGSLSFTTGLISSSITYYAESRNSTTDCISATRTAVTATINEVPAIPAANNNFRCGSGAVTISATAGSGETIDWYADASGGTPLSSGSASFITGTISSTTTYYAEARNSTTDCISTARIPVVASVLANSTSTTAVSICSGTLPFIWNNNTFTQGGIYEVLLSNAAGCDSVARLLLDVAATPTVFNVTGGGTFNIGGPGVPVGLSGSQPGTSYQLLLNGIPLNGAIITGTGSAISFGNQTGAGEYAVVASPGALCTQDMNGTVTVTITAAPPVVFTVTGGGTYCVGGSGIAIGLSGSEIGVSYQLKRNNGTINAGSPVPGNNGPISFGLQITADNYTVVATNTTTLVTQPMLNSVFVRVAAIRAPTAPGAITGPTDACLFIGQGNATYTIRQAANATSYIWTAPAGATIIGSNTDTLVVVQFSPSFVSGNLSVRSVNSCFNNATSSARSLAIVKRVPATPGTITASLTNPCSVIGTGNTINYTIRKVAYASSYAWSVTAGMNIISNLGDTGIVVSFDPGYTTGTIGVIAGNSCANSAQRSLVVTSVLPALPSVISGPSNVCTFIGQPQNAVYAVAPVIGAASYLWTAPANATIISGQGTTQVEISFASNYVSGTLTVKSVATCGSSATRNLSLVKTVARPGAISASAAACPLTTVTYSIAAVPFATSYLWTIPVNATYVSGQGTTNFVVTYNAAFVSGSVSVKSINACGSSSNRTLAVNNTSCVAPKIAQAPEYLFVKAEPKVFPNPGNGNFNVQIPVLENTTGMVKLQLIDMFGKLVFEQREYVNKSGLIDAKVAANHLSSGIYELRYTMNNKIQSIKVMIIK